MAEKKLTGPEQVLLDHVAGKWEPSVHRNVEDELDIAVARTLLSAVAALDRAPEVPRTAAIQNELSRGLLHGVPRHRVVSWLLRLREKKLLETPVGWVRAFRLTADGKTYLRGFLPAPVGLTGGPTAHECRRCGRWKADCKCPGGGS